MATVPSTGRVTAPYGPRTVRPTPTSPLFHYGEDTIGDGNYAPEAGTIVACGYAGAYGNRVVIETPAGVQWSLCHNRNLNGRRVGQWVREGEFVAPMGATGNVTGIHVHTERRTNRGTVHTNPRPAYTSAAGGGTTPIPPKPGKPAPTPTAVPVPEEDEVSITIIALRRDGQPDYTAKCSITAIKGGYEETGDPNTADEFYSLAGVNAPHRVFSGNALTGGNEEATRRYKRALAGFKKGRADYLAAKAEESKK